MSKKNKAANVKAVHLSEALSNGQSHLECGGLVPSWPLQE